MAAPRSPSCCPSPAHRVIYAPPARDSHSHAPHSVPRVEGHPCQGPSARLPPCLTNARPPPSRGSHSTAGGFAVNERFEDRTTPALCLCLWRGREAGIASLRPGVLFPTVMVVAGRRGGSGLGAGLGCGANTEVGWAPERDQASWTWGGWEASGGGVLVPRHGHQNQGVLRPIRDPEGEVSLGKEQRAWHVEGEGAGDQRRGPLQGEKPVKGGQGRGGPSAQEEPGSTEGLGGVRLSVVSRPQHWWEPRDRMWTV